MTGRKRTRRRFLGTASAGLVLGFAGCSGRSNSQGTATNTTTDSTPATSTGTRTDTGTPSGTETGTATEAGEDAPGYIQDHWHGRLFFEIDGELVNFDRPKYYLENLESEHPETVYFHFHEDEDAHAPNEWSNEKQVVTFQRALNLLPDIGYEQQSGSHVVTYDGTTYDGRKSGTSVSIVEGTQPIDPTSYQVAHDDDYYVQITTEDEKRSAEPAHDGADLGTLLFDMNNVRVDFSREKFVGPEAASEAFHFHDDGSPYMWYKEGSVTLAEALNAVSGIEYEKESGNHVISYDDEQRTSYSLTYDAGRPEHEVTIKQRTTPVDPTSYELAAGDVIWVYVESDFLPKNEH